MDGKAKKALGCGCLIALCIPILLLISVFAVPIIVDDVACAAFLDRIENTLILPDNIRIIETVSGCGNSSGTGDHTELAVAIIVESEGEISPSELETAIGADFISWVSSYDSSDYRGRWTAESLGFSFDTLPAENRFIIWAIESAPMSWLDLRGV